MTDSKLRELERRWKETQSVEDEAAYLLERVRVGDLDREKLELAAYCGHEGAREALAARPRIENLIEWLHGLSAWGDTALARASVSIARSVAHLWRDAFPGDSSIQTCLEALEAWLDCPCQEHCAQVAAASDPLDELAATARDRIEEAGTRTAANHASQAALVACAVSSLVLRTEELTIEDAIGRTAKLAAWVAEPSMDAICNELIPWALGLPDPVRERVEARQQASP